MRSSRLGSRTSRAVSAAKSRLARPLAIAALLALLLLSGTLVASGASPRYGWKQALPVQTQLFTPSRVDGASSACVDQSGTVWVLDTVAAKVSRFSADGALLASWGGVAGANAGDLSAPSGLAVGPDGLVYIADTGNHRVQVFEADGTFVRQFGSYGSGVGQLNGPSGVALDSALNVYVTEAFGNRVQVFNPAGVSAGIWTFPGMSNPHGIAISNEGGTEYAFIADSGGLRIIKATLAGGVVNASIGLSPGPGGSTISRFGFLAGLRVDSAGRLWVSDRGKNRIEKCDLAGNVLATFGSAPLGGSGPLEFDIPVDAMADASGTLYVADSGNARIARIDSVGTWLDPWAATVPISPRGAAFDASGGVWVADPNAGVVRHYSSAGATLTSVGESILASPTSVALGPGGGLYVSDSALCAVVVFDGSGVPSGTIGTTGTADGQFASPQGLTVAGDGTILVADTGNSRIQQFDSTGAWQRSFGTSGAAGSGLLASPRAVAVDATGTVYVADTGNHRVQVFTPAGDFVTSWGGLTLTGVLGQFSQPSGIAVGAGGSVFVSDFGNDRVQRFDNFSGTPSVAFGSFGARQGQLAGPWGVAVSASGTVAVAESRNHRVTIFAPDATPPTTSVSLQPPGWSNSSVKVTLTAGDDVGVAATYYRIGTGAPIRYTRPFYVTTEGVTTVYYWSVDRSGATGTTNSTYAMIDKTSPMMTSLTSPTHPSLVTMPFGAPVLDWSAADNNTIAGYSYSVDTSAGASPDAVVDTAGTQVRLTSLPGGVWYFHVRARDDAGNWSATSTYRIAFTTPVRVGTPLASRVTGRTFRVSGVVYPAHRSGIYVWAERYANGTWTRARTYPASLMLVPGGSSRYLSVVSLPSGTWRFRAYHAFDGQHPGTASLPSASFVVP